MGSFLANPCIPQVQRYATANRNSFMKNLDLLSKAKRADDEDEVDAEMPEKVPQSESRPEPCRLCKQTAYVLPCGQRGLTG